MNMEDLILDVCSNHTKAPAVWLVKNMDGHRTGPATQPYATLGPSISCNTNTHSNRRHTLK